MEPKQQPKWLEVKCWGCGHVIAFQRYTEIPAAEIFCPGCRYCEEF